MRGLGFLLISQYRLNFLVVLVGFWFSLSDLSAREQVGLRMELLVSPLRGKRRGGIGALRGRRDSGWRVVQRKRLPGQDGVRRGAPWGTRGRSGSRAQRVILETFKTSFHLVTLPVYYLHHVSCLMAAQADDEDLRRNCGGFAGQASFPSTRGLIPPSESLHLPFHPWHIQHLPEPSPPGAPSEEPSSSPEG